MGVILQRLRALCLEGVLAGSLQSFAGAPVAPAPAGAAASAIPGSTVLSTAPGTAAAGHVLVVDKGAFTLSILNAKGDTVATYPVATGRNPGCKRKPGDYKTPEGTFTVSWVQNTRGVLYDYHDGNGPVEAYGPWFIHFDTPHSQVIGIHGSCRQREHRVGTRDSLGCIRLRNDDLRRVVPYVRKGTRIVILPGPEDIAADGRPDPS